MPERPRGANTAFDVATKPSPLPEPTFPALADEAAAAEALKVITDVWKNEETRFNNLNTRGVAVISAASVVTTLLGFFTKNLLDNGATGLAGWARTVAVLGAGSTLLLLAATIGLVVFGVLRPGRRDIFGANPLVSGGVEICDTLPSFDPGAGLRTWQVDRIAFGEYATIYVGLANRSETKAYWLTLAYYCFFVALLLSALTTIAVFADSF